MTVAQQSFEVPRAEDPGTQQAVAIVFLSFVSSLYAAELHGSAPEHCRVFSDRISTGVLTKGDGEGS